jgi:hypothetical protein
MNTLRKVLFVALGGTLVLVMIAVVAPRVAHAVVAALVRDVDNPGRATIVHQSCFAGSQAGFNRFSCSPAYAVPAGQRFVVEQAEASCETPAGNSVNFASFLFTETGDASTHSFFLMNEGPDPANGIVGFTFNQAVRYYADPDSTLKFQATTSDTTGATGCLAQLNGYLISYP